MNDEGVLRVATICKANLFRSPAARVFLADAFGSVGIHAIVTSGGILPGGNVVSAEYQAIATEVGLDLSEHVSHEISAADLRAQDVIFAMTRELLRELVVMEPSIWPRAFTMREFARRAQRVGPRKPTQSLESWVDVIGQGRTRSELLGDHAADDVADPVGGTAEDYLTMLHQVHKLAEDIASLF